MKNNNKLYNLLTLSAILFFVTGCSLVAQPTVKETKPGEMNTTTVEPETDNVEKDIIKNSEGLDLSGRNLDKLDMSIFNRRELESLDVSNNNLSGALPSQIGNLKNLKVLDASDNNFTGIPAEVGQLNQLEVLDFSNNSLTGLPYELGNLKNLKTFNISGNQFSEYDLNIIREKLPNTAFITQ